MSFLEYLVEGQWGFSVVGVGVSLDGCSVVIVGVYSNEVFSSEFKI